MNPYRLLAAGIINTALRDYRRALKRSRKEFSESIALEIYELESFFHSKWFSLLCDDSIDPDELIKRFRRKFGNL